MDVLGFLTIGIVGFTACAEFGSYAFVHPIIRGLPPREHLQVERGLLRTFGRFMPIAMPLSLILAIANASVSAGHGGPAIWRWLAVASLATALISTVVFNVPINLTTGRWDLDNPPNDWKQTRTKWEFFQGLRSWLLLIGFIMITIGFTT